MADISVLIPARNERWLARTIDDVCTHAKADTEVIAVLDGAWPEPGYELPQRPNVTVIYLPQAIGQRAATNLAARVSTARYVMKLDAHCAVADGFDAVLLQAAQELGDDVTQIPSQRNLHVFDRICQSCQKREYQGPTDVPCVVCGETTWHIEVVWHADRKPTHAWGFTAEPKFMYFGDYARRPEAQGDIVDVMSSLGACFFMSRDRFWQLGGLDEQHGSWGQFGIEIACKSWLSGGRHVVNKRTWFSHMFRTQGHDFSFPYPISGAEQDKARQHSRDLWLCDAWPGQVRPLRWLVDKFWPVTGWDEAQRQALRPRLPGQSRTKGIVYYSDNRLDPEIAEASRRSIEASGLPIVAVTLQPIRWPAARNIVLPLERGYLTLFRQMLAGLEALETDDVFFCEHDVVYHPSHFAFSPPTVDRYYYNLSWYKVEAASGRGVTYEAKQTSQLCADRQLLIAHYRERVARVEREGFSRAMGFEPGSHRRPQRIDDVPSETWRSSGPNFDIRHQQNLTPSRWRQDQFRDQRHCQGWHETTFRLEDVLGTVQQAVA